MNKKIFLSESHPALAAEAIGWDPANITAGSGKVLRWKCSEGHVYEAPVYSRTSAKPTGCPYCSNRKVLSGFNDLKTTHPEIAKEAIGWDPTQFSAGMAKKMEWKCSKGHRYSSVIHSRSKGIGCPVCSNRKVELGVNDLKTTHPEIAKEANKWNPSSYVAGSDKIMEWKCSKGHLFKSAIKNRALKNVGCSVCSNRKVEVGVNDLAKTHPALASQANGWDPHSVTAESHKKMEWKCEKGHIWSALVNSRSRGRGCPVCTNQVLQVGINDLATTNPEIAKQAFEWDPSTVLSGSKIKKLWKCEKGHVWDAAINTRLRESGHGCPFCSNHRLLVGFNDFATTHPYLLGEVNGWDPTKIIAGAREKKSWKCKEGHIWETSIGARTGSKESGCPSCAKYGYDPQRDGWLYFLEHEKWNMFQIGITNVPDVRLSVHKKNGWQIIEIRGPMEGHMAQKWESSILRMLKSCGADLANRLIAGKFDGYTEAWSKEKFSVKTISELMMRTEEWENR